MALLNKEEVPFLNKLVIKLNIILTPSSVTFWIFLDLYLFLPTESHLHDNTPGDMLWSWFREMKEYEATYQLHNNFSLENGKTLTSLKLLLLWTKLSEYVESNYKPI